MAPMLMKLSVQKEWQTELIAKAISMMIVLCKKHTHTLGKQERFEGRRLTSRIRKESILRDEEELDSPELGIEEWKTSGWKMMCYGLNICIPCPC